MRKFLALVTAVMAAVSVLAAPVDQATAFKKAQSFLNNQLYKGQLMAPAATQPVLLKAEVGETKINQPVYYIFNTSTTFLVIAGDDRAEEVLMIGDKPLDLNRIPDGLQYLLDCYKEQISFLQVHPGLVVEPVARPTLPKLNATTTYGPLLTCNWDQEAPYNNLCKFTYDGTEYTCLTGCPATSAAQVMYFWKHPTTPVPALSSYSSTLDIAYQNSVNFTYPALPSTTFDWDNMLDTYTKYGYNAAQGNAVATLMRYVGQAEKMIYGTSAAGGSGIYTTQTQRVVNMFTTFGYDPNTTKVIYKSNYTATNWANTIIAELAAGRPVVYNGVDNSVNGGGHAFNVDGYDSSTNKYHVNFGWSGDGNNWYAMNAFSYAGNTFSSDQQAIIGIQPEDPIPTLSTTTTTLDFNPCYPNETATKTFTLRGRYLTGNISLSVSGEGYTVSPTTVTKEEALSGVTVTVTYTPTELGTASGTVTATSAGAQTLTVPLTSTTVTKPVITSSRSSMSFSTTVGSQQKKTFILKGSNLASNVTLSLSGTGFTIDATVVTMAQAQANTGRTITVTFAPTEAGSYTGSITLSATGANPVVIPLSGTATDNNPRIFVNSTSLAFEGTPGETVRQSFTVSGANLTGDATLTLNDEDGVFSLNKTTLTASQVASGTSVTVTYAPVTFGEHSATVTISGGGAEPVTVNLDGVASLTKFNPVLLEPNDAYVAMTQFRAQWTDETPAQNVESYTLEVNAKVVEPQLIGTLDGSAYTGSYKDITLTAPWGGTDVRGGNSAVYFRIPGNITFTIPEGYSNETFTVMIKTVTSNYGAGSFAVSTPQTAAQSRNVTAGSSTYWVVTASSGETITITSSDDSYSPDIALIEVYSGDATPVTLTATETGGANYRLIEGITPNQYYTVTNLTAGGTFLYRVKALYIDGTQSEWTDEKEVTLHENSHPFEVGDVNHDGFIQVDDVSTMIASILGHDVTMCDMCADVNADGKVDISDVSALINKVLGK